MGKSLLPQGIKCVIVSISVTPAQLARLKRRVAEERAKGNLASATVSGVIRLDGHASARLRHDLRGLANSLLIHEQGYKEGVVSTPELLEAMRNVATEIMAIVAEEGGG